MYFCNEKHVIGKDESGFYIAEMIKGVIKHKHKITAQNAIDLIKKWVAK